ncbi:hypothetical protein Ptr86124_002297 [Pyrenophora tritici-repentis]|uniref:Uncharacterized protein n=1 Tax=Pyrenophora tritici-repentis TaxID=45151 RepID=A0A922NJT3_9PLEO|nr:hypothetical protein Ptr86124_002297 [Pyrenophora tritici-repentis]
MCFFGLCSNNEFLAINLKSRQPEFNVVLPPVWLFQASSIFS